MAGYFGEEEELAFGEIVSEASKEKEYSLKKKGLNCILALSYPNARSSYGRICASCSPGVCIQRGL